jgi:hypothetical protein
MSDDDQAGLASLPLLVKFAQLQLDNGLAYCYDTLQHLNISAESGEPVVASARARSMLKTQSQKQWAED